MYIDNNIKDNEIIPLGKIYAPYAVKGEFLVKTYTQQSILIEVKQCFLLPKHDVNNVNIKLNIKKAKYYKNGVLLACEEFNAPEQIKSLLGSEVCVYKNQLPKANENEFYWVDLIGSIVINMQNKVLGKVKNLMHNGAQSILCIHAKPNIRLDEEILIPFTKTYIIEVNLLQKTIIVDWE